MRYQSVPTVVFTDVNGNQYPIKDTRVVSNYQTMMNLKVEQNAELDDIISSRDVYGDGMEWVGYAVVDLNIIAFVEADFDLAQIKTLNIPILSD